MSKHFIIQTGHGKGLSRMEILALLGDVIRDEVFDGFVIELSEKQSSQSFIQNLQDRMGGTVRITEVLHDGPAHMPLNFSEWVTQALMTEWGTESGKKRFGLSMHPKDERVLKKTLNNAKNDAKKDVGNVRYVNKNFQNLSSVQAWHEKLLKDGAIELHLFKSEKRWYLSKTLTIQNFEWYSLRDYKRPRRDARNGMLPPKLSQILINLTLDGNEEPETIFDPFCGNGTVLQEARLMGYDVVGSDLEADKVKDTEANLDWLEKQAVDSGHSISLEEPTLFQADATKLTTEQIPKDCAIATETWLGPAISVAPKPLERPKLQREIEALYDAFFGNLKEKKATKAPITVVFTAAYYKEKNDRHFLPNLPQILARHGKIIPLSQHERPSLFYERKGQVVGREIWKVQI